MLPDATTNPSPASRGPLTLTAEQVHQLGRYAHPIPICSGRSQLFVERRYPGWQWNDILPVLLRAGVINQVNGAWTLPDGHVAVLPGDGTATLLPTDPPAGPVRLEEALTDPASRSR